MLIATDQQELIPEMNDDNKCEIALLVCCIIGNDRSLKRIGEVKCEMRIDPYQFVLMIGILGICC